jgi:hypothetical protein
MKPRTAVAFTIALLIGISAGAQGSWSTHTSAGEYAFARGDLSFGRRSNLRRDSPPETVAWRRASKTSHVFTNISRISTAHSP